MHELNIHDLLLKYHNDYFMSNENMETIPQDLRLSAIQEELILAEHRCNSLRGQLKQAWDMYQQVNGNQNGNIENRHQYEITHETLSANQAAALQSLTEGTGLVLSREVSQRFLNTLKNLQQEGEMNENEAMQSLEFDFNECIPQSPRRTTSLEDGLNVCSQELGDSIDFQMRNSNSGNDYLSNNKPLTARFDDYDDIEMVYSKYDTLSEDHMENARDTSNTLTSSLELNTTQAERDVHNILYGISQSVNRISQLNSHIGRSEAILLQNGRPDRVASTQTSSKQSPIGSVEAITKSLDNHEESPSEDLFMSGDVLPVRSVDLIPRKKQKSGRRIQKARARVNGPSKTATNRKSDQRTRPTACISNNKMLQHSKLGKHQKNQPVTSTSNYYQLPSSVASINQHNALSTTSSLRKRKGVTQLKVSPVDHSIIQARETPTNSSNLVARPRPRTPILKSDIASGMLDICGQYTVMSKNLVELYHNVSAVESTSETQVLPQEEQTYEKPPARKAVPPKVQQCWYRKPSSQTPPSDATQNKQIFRYMSRTSQQLLERRRLLDSGNSKFAKKLIASIPHCYDTDQFPCKDNDAICLGERPIQEQMIIEEEINPRKLDKITSTTTFDDGSEELFDMNHLELGDITSERYLSEQSINTANLSKDDMIDESIDYSTSEEQQKTLQKVDQKQDQKLRIKEEKIIQSAVKRFVQPIQHQESKNQKNTIKNYQLPTVSSRMKSMVKTMNLYNFRKIPFVVAKSTTPSHNLGLNIQTVLSIIKGRQKVAGISPTLAANMGIQSESVPACMFPRTPSTHSKSRPTTCPILKKSSQCTIPEKGEEKDLWSSINMKPTGSNERCTCYPDKTMNYTEVVKEFLKEGTPSQNTIAQPEDEYDSENTEHTISNSRPDSSHTQMSQLLRQDKVMADKIKKGIEDLYQEFANLTEKKMKLENDIKNGVYDSKSVSRELRMLKEACAAKEQKIDLVLSLQHRVTSLRDIRTAICEGKIVHRIKKSPGTTTMRLTKLLRSIQQFQERLLKAP